MSKVISGLSGLENLGNTCYLNSILQILSNTKELREFIFDTKFIDLIYKFKDNINDLVSLQIFKLFKVIWKNNLNYEPISIIELLNSKIKCINIKEQNDAHEILIYILDYINTEIKIPVKKIIQNNNKKTLLEEAAFKFQIQNYKNISIIKELFEYIIIFEDRCIHTKNINYSFQENYILSLEINHKTDNSSNNLNSDESDNESNDEIFNKFICNIDSDNDSISSINLREEDNDSISSFNFREEEEQEEEDEEVDSNDNESNSFNNSDNESVISNNNNIIELYDLLNYNFKINNLNDVYCEKCKKKITKERTTYLWQLPNILIIHINKNDENYNYKYNYPLELDMTRYVHPDNTNNKIYKYELYAINIRIRFSFESGHYYSYCKNNNDWYRYNDSYVKKIDDITEIDKDINMLFYKII